MTLPERLRDHAVCSGANCDRCEAAAALEAKDAEIERLRELVEIGAACVFGESTGLWITPGENEYERFTKLYDQAGEAQR